MQEEANGDDKKVPSKIHDNTKSLCFCCNNPNHEAKRDDDGEKDIEAKVLEQKKKLSNLLLSLKIISFQP